MASTQGYRAGRWNLVFYLLLGVAIALAIKAIGILLMFAFLVIPASLGLVLTRRLGGRSAWRWYRLRSPCSSASGSHTATTFLRRR